MKEVDRRDYFAGQALRALIIAHKSYELPNSFEIPLNSIMSPSDIAEKARIYADAMIRELDKYTI